MGFEEELIFEAVENCGFRYGSKNTPMLFIPCYSEQNVFYSTNIEIFYNNEKVLCSDREEVFE